ncbi:MAG: hypothetical protein O3B13_07680 [Planctomycetota bacterium]|nr:hypothetical protein [Planctomycetota bacterium]
MDASESRHNARLNETFNHFENLEVVRVPLSWAESLSGNKSHEITWFHGCQLCPET